MDPQTDHRHVQDHQDDAADPETHHQAPEHLGLPDQHLRAGMIHRDHERSMIKAIVTLPGIPGASSSDEGCLV